MPKKTNTPKVKKDLAARKQRKEGLRETVHQCLDEYTHVYAVGMDHVSRELQDATRQLADGKIVFGKRTVLCAALGRDEASSYRENIFKLGELIPRSMTCGLLFTNDARALDSSEAHHLKDLQSTETLQWKL
eukprot:TRINITY_DN879_c0_g1_i3.p1 TRINITY_DN879_c0_g1~~TRINITY_DN879_c0_g1_i3.p1  ORF type:complete len:132 (-),score=25.22 TRINITY_DN879_c0_g1_i3:294-689(-)